MASDLDLPLEVRGCPTVREPDGLALSSRNQRLTSEERRQAVHIIKGLRLAEELRRNGETSAVKLDKAVRDYWRIHIPNGEIDYLEFVRPDTLAPAGSAKDPVIAAAAVKFSQARLIDNILLEV